MRTGTRVRLTPEQRRDQLLDLGVRLLAGRTLEELSIDMLAEEAGVSRGLLYHYFGTKTGFGEAVVRRAADDLIARTAPPAHGDAVTRLRASLDAYLAYVEENLAGYLSLLRAAAGGNETMRALHDEARGALVDRVFTFAADDAASPEVPDTPLVRLAVRGWAASTEEQVLAWLAEPGGVTREQLLDLVTAALPALVETATTTG